MLIFSRAELSYSALELYLLSNRRIKDIQGQTLAMKKIVFYTNMIQ